MEIDRKGGGKGGKEKVCGDGVLATDCRLCTYARHTASLCIVLPYNRWLSVPWLVIAMGVPFVKPMIVFSVDLAKKRFGFYREEDVSIEKLLLYHSGTASSTSAINHNGW